jgi:hypothetical protein
MIGKAHWVRDIPKIRGWIRLWPCPGPLIWALPYTSNFVTETAESLYANWRHNSSALCICNCNLSLHFHLHPNSPPFLPRTSLLPIRMCPSWNRSIHVPSLASLSVEKRWWKNGAWQQNGRMESCLGAA